MLSPTPPIDRPSLHPGTGYFIGPRVPHGLAAVVEGLTREVLRHRPEDIYVFAAHHFEKLLKLREQYHADEYSGREFNGDFNREFNLWPTKEPKNDGRPSISGWSLDKEIEILEKRRKARADMEESPEDISIDREKQKTSKQKCSRDTSNTKRASKRSTKDNETISDARATRIISHMSVLHSNGRNIQTKDIKQELRKNKLSSEKGKTDSVEKGVRGERRSKTRVSKIGKDTEEEVETTTTTTSDRTSTRRPLRKVRRIETESETETEFETVARTKLENGYEKSSVKDDNANREAANIQNRSRERRSEAAARLSAHSSGRKVSSRALSMDRIRAYVLRKFASTASLEVLRSPTYVEQVQEVIDRAAPIIKEKLEEINRPRGKRSRSVDLGWNEELLRQHTQDRTRYDYNREEEKVEESMRKKKAERRKSGNGIGREADTVKRKETEDSPKMEDQSTRNGTMQDMEREERRRRSVGSGKKSRRRESGGRVDSEIIDRIDDDSRHSTKSEHELSAVRDTLEARLTSTQNILEDISMATSELGGVRKIDLADGEHEPSESEISDQINIVSLPIVRPPSSKSCKNAARNESDSLTLPPISPEAPRSTKKKDELSLPVLPAAGNGNHPARKSQEQDSSKDAEEASTMRDVTSDIEDIVALPEDEQKNSFVDMERDLTNDHQKVISDVKSFDEEKNEGDNYEDKDIVLRENISLDLDKKRVSDVSLDRSFEELDEPIRPEEGKMEEIFVDSLNVTPEVDIPMRPDSLEPNEDEQEKPVREDDVNLAQSNMFDGLKDRLIEIEMAERSIEKALASQHVVTHDGGATSEAEKSTTGGKISEVRKSTSEVEEIESEIEKSTDERKISSKESTDEVEELTNEVRRTENTIKRNKTRDSTSTTEKLTNGMEELKNEIKNSISATERSINKVEEMENGIETSVNELNNLTNIIERSTNDVEKSINEQLMSEIGGLKNNIEKLNNGIKMAMNQAEMSTKVAEEALIEKEKLMKKTGVPINEEEKLSNSVEELMVKRHIKYLQSTNSRSQDTNEQITEAAAFEMDGNDDVTASRNKAGTTNGLLKTTAFGNAATETENLKENLPGESSNETKARKRREIAESLATTPLSLKIPFSYVLSEGSPCEIPDSVTTVIIPDRPCPSPVTPEIEEPERESTACSIGERGSAISCDIVASLKHETPEDEDGRGYGMEAFGEYIRPESADLPVDIDFMRGVKDAKPSQDIMIVHQDLDRIKEEGEEEEEEKESDKEGEKDDAEMVARNYEIAKLEDIAEHEENEEIDERTNVKPKDTNEISFSHVPEYESLPDTVELIANADVTDGERADVVVESRSMPENSSIESGSSQDVCTTISSDMRENTTSNRSIESPSADRPIVPELNLDSLQDNTVSSFKMTATKESNGSPRESDATTSLVEPLTPDERLTVGNRLVVADRGEEAVGEELTENSTRGLQSDVPEADQLYRAEYAEYKWMEKDPLSSETDSEDKMKSQEDMIDAKDLLEDTVCAGSILQQEKETEDLGSEEEIARELISSLDKDVQLRDKEMDIKEESKDNRRSVEGNLDVDDSCSQPLLESMHSISIDELEKGEVSSKKDETLGDERTAVIETISEISVTDIRQTHDDRDSAITGEETEESKLDIIEKEHSEIRQIAPLAEFEQDELLEKNGSYEMIDEKITVENKSDTDNSHCTDDQKEVEDVKMSVEEVSENQSNEDMSKDEKFAKEQKDDQRDRSIDQQKCGQEPLDIQEECEQEKYEIQRENGDENLRVPAEVHAKTVISEITESRKGSMKESIEDKDNFMEDKETVKFVIRDEIVSDNQTKTDAENKKEEKITDLSEVESVHGPITSAISKQSTEDNPHGRYWTTGTKSSTMETVIAAFDSDADEKAEAFSDVPEIIKDESITQQNDDFYSAVIKLQACTRGFLARRHMRKNACSEPISDKVPLMQKTTTSSRLTVPEDHSNLREARTGRQRLRREEALRKATLSVENAFATSRLQHTGEFHDSVPLPLYFDTTNNETNSIPLNESSGRKCEEDVEHGKHDITGPNINEGDYDHFTLDDEHQESSQKGTTHFVDHSTFPIMMHLLADATRNSHFAVNSDPGFNAKSSGTNFMQSAVDILMLGYPRDDVTLQNRYLNFITSVEDVDSSMDSLPLGDAMKSSKNTNDAHPSIASGDGSLMEPLALSNTPQGVVIEELTSLDEAVGDVPSTRSESAKSSIVPTPLLNTNNSLPPEERAPEDERNDLEMSSRTSSADKGDAIECSRENTDEKAEKQSGENPVEAADCNSENAADSRRNDETEKSSEISHDSKEHTDEGKNEKA